MAPLNARRLERHELRTEGTRFTTLWDRRTRHRLALLFLMLPASVFAIAQSLRFDIPAQPLPAALKAFADQAKIQLLYRHDAVKGATGNAVVGDYDTRDALRMLLRGTGLEAVYSNDNAATIRPRQTTAQATAATPRANEQRPSTQTGTNSAETAAPEAVSEDTRQRRSELEEILVTGSHIRGIPGDFSPLVTYSSEAITRMGVTSLDQFITRITANASTLSTNGGAVGSVGSERVSNDEAINAIDLRGLGVGTTLVLLNGRRLALSDGARTPDVSLIPLSAIDRVEVLTDGASAIYGSDAVAGVVNFILKDDLQGAQTAVGYGSVTDGGQEEVRLEQSFGGEWGSGRGLLGYSYLDRDALDGRDRSFAAVASPYSLIPADQRHNVLATLDQRFGESVEGFADFLYSRRDTDSASTRRLPFFNPVPNVVDSRDTEQNQYFANVGLRADWSDRLRGELLTSYSRVETGQDWRSFDSQTQIVSPLRTDALASTFDVTVKVDGNLLALPAGAAKYSLGAGYTEDRYSNEQRTPSFNSRDDLDRRTWYSFAELFIPLVSGAQAVPGIHRLELNLAARHTDYSDFGGQTSPKVALLWAPVPSFRLRGTYGESFRAPFLSQMNPNSIGSTLLRPADFGVGPWAADEVVLFATGTNPNLGPEEADSYTIGFELKPPVLTGLTLSATYFNISYSDRIAAGDATGGIDALFNPGQYPDLLIRAPSANFIAPIVRGSNGGAGPVDGIGTTIDLADPAAVAAITDVVLDNRLRNLLDASLDGVDVGLSYHVSGASRSFDFGAELTKLFDSRQQISSNAPLISVVDTLLNPVDLRVRAYAGLSAGSLAAQLSANYWDDYSDPFSRRGVASWTTLDLAVSYVFESSVPALRDLRIAASVLNLLDKDPPFVAIAPGTAGLGEPIGYDPTNANPLGRFISVQLSKGW